MDLLKRFLHGADSRRALAWVSYDFGNSAYALTMMSFAFPVYFKEALAPEGQGDFLWGLLVGGSSLLCAGLAPWVGAWAPSGRRRHAAFAAFTLFTVAGAGAMGLLPSLSLFTAICLSLFASISFELALVLYDSYLPQLAPPAATGRLSGLGWGLGYLGGLMALVLLRPFYGDGVGGPHAGAGGTGSGDFHYRLTFALAAGFFLLFALPALWSLESRPGGPAPPGLAGARRALGTVRASLKGFRRDPAMLRFLAGSFLLNDALVTLFVFVPVYARTTLGLDLQEIALLLGMVQVMGIPSTIFFGVMADRLGLKRVLLGTLGAWVLIVWVAATARGAPALYFAALLTGLVVGSCQAIVRSWLGQLAPPGEAAEYYGFNVLAGKVSAVAGPVTFGTVSALLGQRLAMASLALPFLAAALLFWRVPDIRSEPGGAAPG